ncbi:hypothetical protein GLAREA_01724 [Glarea lozoyensis ATCC 20868]|uniref:Uncharacterized protein n=1 Tax=Glarea lozoyensis (strain ATCC 20868 / MF5171) TaxID=1116229 RepID=S3CH87_GLAL2|nr:uncharacterized protein GLAREA_01724 [Glarea lozoyensis ATCC 20868]EPE25812.1 hypothetical protein GLAREA_01724 [Glarea lozoyensis ATCC 20868]
MPPQSHRAGASAPSQNVSPNKKAGTQRPEANPKSHQFKLPTLRLEVRDINHEGADVFFASVTANKALQKAVQDVLLWLYDSPNSSTTTLPSTRSVTLILRSMPGVAYTTGSELDSDHKEIHFSLDYIHSIAKTRKTEEILGVLTHEMVHCYQYNAFGTCPGGLIEGIADWVRLNANLSPPHWKQEGSGKWDAGYQHTGYFLQYLEDRFGVGLVRRMNEKLRIERYEEKRFWTELCGRPVEQLWGDYGKLFPGDSKKAEDDECVIVEKEDVGTTTPKQQP